MHRCALALVHSCTPALLALRVTTSHEIILPSTHPSTHPSLYRGSLSSSMSEPLQPNPTTMSTQPPEDLTHDGSLLKTILATAPEDAPAAARGAKVSLRYSIHLTDDIDSPPLDSSTKRRDGLLTFTLGKNKVVPALELVAQSMRKGERCVVRVARAYTLGLHSLRKRGVEKGRELYLHVEMVEVDGGERVKGVMEMTPRERFEQAAVCKEVGNGFFKEQKFDKALAQYRMAIQYLANVYYKVNGARTERSQESSKKADDGFVEAGVNDAEGEEDVQSSEKENKRGSEENNNVNGDATDTKSEEVIQEIDMTTATHSQGDKMEAASGNGAEERGEQETGGEVTEEGDSDGGGTHQSEMNEAGGETMEADDPEEKEVRSLHVTTLNNLSLCFVKVENYRQAVESASMALKLDPESSKALYYR